jgi:hypothetical protein
MIGVGCEDRVLTEEETRDVLSRGLAAAGLSGSRVSAIVPDSTRSGPMPVPFRFLFDLLNPETAALDYLTALGTRPPMSEEAVDRYLGLSPGEREGKCSTVRVFQHRWDVPQALRKVGAISLTTRKCSREACWLRMSPSGSTG